MDIKLLKDYCYSNSQRKWQTAESLYKSKRNSDCLFFCHLALEFILKGKFVEIREEIFPITHDLERMAQAIDLLLSKKQKTDLAIINTFNIAGRYDDYKSSFYKLADRKYTQKYFKSSKELFLWIKNYTIKKK